MPPSIQQYIDGFGQLSEVKEKILRKLWGRDRTPFPKSWVKSSELLALTGQKYFDRRIRELRDEQGCDIETAPMGGEHSYRIKSPDRSTTKPRGYLTETQKKNLFERFQYTCQICGVVTQAGVRGLQADHKIPLIREGSNDEQNWQPICNQCNVGKRGACEGCNDDCHKCPWAFPESVGRVTLLRIPGPMLEALSNRSGSNQRQLEQEIIGILKKELGIS